MKQILCGQSYHTLYQWDVQWESNLNQHNQPRFHGRFMVLTLIVGFHLTWGGFNNRLSIC